MPLVATDGDRDPILICKVIFDVLNPGKVLETLKARPDFKVLEKKERRVTNILWMHNPVRPGESAYGTTCGMTSQQSGPNRAHLISDDGQPLSGIITLSPGRLILKCVTRTHATMGQEILLKVAGPNLRYRITTYETPIRLRQTKNNETNPPSPLFPDHLSPHLPPEFFKSYFEVHWVHEKIPALDGLTPLQCARSKRKKERDRLAALLATFKNSSIGLYDFNRLIDILGFKDYPLLREEHITRQKLREKIMTVIDNNLRFIMAIKKAGGDALTILAQRLAEVNVMLQGLVYFLEQAKRTKTELIALTRTLEQIEEMTQILQTETLSGNPRRKTVEELIGDPDWDHRQVITTEVVDTVTWEIEKVWCENIEQKPISPHTSLTTALNNIPALWVAAIQKNLDLPRKTTKRKNIKIIAENLSSLKILNRIVERLAALSMPAVKALKIIYTHGGIYPYDKLAGLFGGEETDGYFWDKRKPTSPLGLLRSHGLLFVGRTKKEDAYYKIAVIPAEIRQNLSFLEDMPL
ncbi:MAG TPA: hypothetical protein ENN18_08155 [Proteobacteria bacterium]|nr:hypothetical protein [Pseudomonadota bacterium]